MPQFNNHIVVAVSLERVVLWQAILVDNLVVFRRCIVQINRLISFSIYQNVLHNPIAVLVDNVGRLLVGRVGDADDLGLLTVLNRNRWYICLGNRMASNLPRLEVRPCVFRPVAIANLTGNIVNDGIPVELSDLRCRRDLAIRLRHVNRSRNHLVQIPLVGTLDVLTSWRLRAWFNRVVVINDGRIVSNRDRRVRRRGPRKVDRFRNLTIDNLPTSWHIRVDVNDLARLPNDCVGLNPVAILVSVNNVGALVSGYVADANRGVLGLTSDSCLSNSYLRRRVTRNSRNIIFSPVPACPVSPSSIVGNQILHTSPVQLNSLLGGRNLSRRYRNVDRPRNRLTIRYLFGVVKQVDYNVLVTIRHEGVGG